MPNKKPALVAGFFIGMPLTKVTTQRQTQDGCRDLLACLVLVLATTVHRASEASDVGVITMESQTLRIDLSCESLC